MHGGAVEDGKSPKTRSASTLRNNFNSLSHEDSAPVYRVVLTGGPCAGKTTALAVLEERMRSRGFRTFMVPEAASMLFGGGFQFSGGWDAPAQKPGPVRAMGCQVARAHRGLLAQISPMITRSSCFRRPC